MHTAQRSSWAAIFGMLAIGFCGFVGARIVEAGKPVDPQAKKRASAALTEGRKLAEQGKYQDAIASFKSALSADPKAVKAMSEMGLAYYHLKQYPEGEAAMRQAVKTTSEPAHRGRSLYNLALILEAKGDKAGAIAALKQSLKERNNMIVLERLRKLDASAADALDPFKPSPMHGPFATMKDVCKSFDNCKERMKDELSNAGEVFRCESKKPFSTMKKTAVPWKSVQIIGAVCAPHDKKEAGDNTELHLVVQTEKGFFTDPLGTAYWDEGIESGTDIVVDELRLAAGAGGAQRVFLRYEKKGGHDRNNGSDTWENEYLMIAGLGASGIPNATPSILIRTLETESDNGDEEEGTKAKEVILAKAKLNTSFQDDTLELSQSGAKKGSREAQLAPTGKHVLIFP